MGNLCQKKDHCERKHKADCLDGPVLKWKRRRKRFAMEENIKKDKIWRATERKEK